MHRSPDRNFIDGLDSVSRIVPSYHFGSLGTLLVAEGVPPKPSLICCLPLDVSVLYK